jgi:hypothetical protein
LLAAYAGILTKGLKVMSRPERKILYLNELGLAAYKTRPFVYIAHKLLRDFGGLDYYE